MVLRAAICGAIAAASLVPGTAHAAAPANDNFANAQTIPSTIPFSVLGTNVGATPESGEPNHFSSTFTGPWRSVWYRWTPPTSGLVRLQVCPGLSGGPTYAPWIAVYTGTALNALTAVKKSNSCVLSLTVTAGTEYRIAIDAPLVEGSFSFGARVPNPPPNDDFANATALGSALSLTTNAYNVDATDEPGEPGGENVESVWFDWTPGSSGRENIDVCNDNGVRVAVFTGSQINSLTKLADTGNDCRLQVDVTGGEVYKIVAYSSYYFEGGHYLSIRPVDAPANDNLSDARVIPGALPAAITATNLDATAEPGEPNHFTRFDGSGALASVWFQWTAPFSGFVHVDTCDSDEYKGVAVYTGTTIAGLHRLAFSHQDCFLYFAATAGQTYKIAVDSYPREEDQFTLLMHHMSPPANDDFANATVVGPDLPVRASATSLDSTGEPGEPDHVGFGDGGRGSTWFSWTPDSSVQAVIDVCDGGADAVAVYTGTQVNSLTPVASNWRCSVTFDAAAGTTYRIAEEEGRYQGPYTLDIHELHRPANDAFGDAQVLPADLPGPLAGTTQDATYEDGETHWLSEPADGSVWYRWTPATSQQVAVKLCDPSPVAFRVWSGPSLDALSQVAENGEDCIAHFHATAGVQYWITVEGRTRSGADFTLDLHRLDPPANDDFANATSIGSLPVTIRGTTVDAGREAHEFDDFAQSVWYRWTPSQSMYATVDVCQSDYDTYLAAYTGVSRISDFENFGTFSTSGWSDDDCGPGNPKGSKMRITAIAGQTYWITVAGRGEGSFRLRMDGTPASSYSGGTYFPPPRSCAGAHGAHAKKCALAKCRHRPKRQRNRCKAKVRKRFGHRRN
jgi:hypothetical protein